MDKFLKFMDICCIDPRLYWRVPSQDSKTIFEIEWRREDRTRWRMRPVGEVLWQLSSEQQLMGDLQSLNIDLYLFEIKLKNTLLQQVTFAERIVRDARQIFGPAMVDQAILEHNSFLKEIEEAVVQLAKPQKPKLRLVQEEIAQEFS